MDLKITLPITDQDCEDGNDTCPFYAEVMGKKRAICNFFNQNLKKTKRSKECKDTLIENV